ncbi:MAG: metallophosphoesterase, partial [Methylocapsa sp.]|nr:metallophosphoesterase [Methylocapsa sp.]
DLLRQLFSRIDRDLRADPPAEAIQVYLGDYIDRGNDSAGVLELLVSRGQTHWLCCLKGNHEIFLAEFLENPSVLGPWAQYGGLPTLASYGLKPAINASAKEQEELSAALRTALPDSHSHFFSELKLSFSCGDYYFVHAGVRPGRPLAAQAEEDLLWIREEFLLHEQPFEKIIVHGHTPVKEPMVKQNRINIDTGAYATGRLTCLRLEGDTIQFI